MEKHRSNIILLIIITIMLVFYVMTGCNVSKGIGRDFIDNTANNKGAYGPFTFL